jgi:hypothetical protein
MGMHDNFQRQMLWYGVEALAVMASVSERCTGKPAERCTGYTPVIAHSISPRLVLGTCQLPLLMPWTPCGPTAVPDSSLLFRSLFHNSFRTVPKGAECAYHTRKHRKNGCEIDTKKLPLGAMDPALPLAWSDHPPCCGVCLDRAAPL